MSNKRNRTSYKNAASKYVKQEVGVLGLSVSQGKIKEDSIPALAGPKKVKLIEEMVNYDPTIGAFNNMFQSMASAVDWRVKPSDKENKESVKIADFISSVFFKDLGHSFQDIISNALTHPQYGFAIAEPVYKIRNGKKSDKDKSSLYDDGLVGLSKVPSRYQGSINRWKFDDNYREISGVYQRDPNTYGETEIPYSRLLHFKHRSLNGDPSGRSIYLNCVKPYLKKKYTSINEDIRYERGFDGIIDIEAPPDMLDPNTTNSAYIQAQRTIADAAQNIRNGTNLAWVHPHYIKMAILSAGEGNIPDAHTIIDRENRNISVALLADFFLTEQSSGTSGGFTQSKIKIFTNLIKESLNEIRREINHKLIPILLDKNLMDEQLIPTLEFSEIEDLDLTNLMLFIQSADKSGLVPPTLGMSNAITKRVLGNDAPETSQKEFDSYQDRREVQVVSNDDGEIAKEIVENNDDNNEDKK